MHASIRILVTLLALTLGGMLIYALTYVGKQTQGPIEDALTGAGAIVREAEDAIILKQRSETRAGRLDSLKRDTAALRHPESILLGAFDENAQQSLKAIFDLEQALGTTFSLIQLYTAWGSRESQRFPTIPVESILKSGSIPVITWEPWLTDFDATEFPNGLRPVETRDKNGLRDIADGVYDAYLREWARAAAAVGRPIFLRMGHEMNDPYRYPWGPQNNAATDFIAAWRHVHQLFQQEQATNVLWIWSPHPAYGWFEEYYPGADVVDWVGLGALNYGTVAQWSQWWTFEDIFGKYYPDLAVFEKPIMICEFGSLAVGGDRETWYSEALTDLPDKYPLVRSILFFHFSDDRTTTQQALDWTIKNDTAILRAISDAIHGWPATSGNTDR
ncbi:MAG: cellulase [Bacteroidetes bacterium]|nr:MAG: cellulase [Bacteroidota bacterium]